MSREELLEKRIAELEQEVLEREQDIASFRNELAQTNKALEGLIARIGRELKLVSRIQKSLVPTELPEIPGFEFSSKFQASANQGGDYFDIFGLGDKSRFAILMTSSSGSMVSALLLSAVLVLNDLMESKEDSLPHQVIDHIVRQIAPEMEEEKDTASLFYSVFDRRSFEYSYCLMGDVVALLKDYTTGELKVLGPAFGKVEKTFNEKLHSESVLLNPRDLIILVSPGLLTVKNLAGEEFGRERFLHSIISNPDLDVHAMRNKILFEVENFSEGVSFPDDVTVVISKVKDRVIKLA